MIDAEHGRLDFNETLEHLRAARHTDTTALIRVQETEEELIKRVVDTGAQGALIPQVRNAGKSPARFVTPNIRRCANGRGSKCSALV